MKCRHCHSALSLRLVDLGFAPPSNAYLDREQLSAPEKWYPLRVLVCRECWLAQTEDYASREELFTPEYAYFSSYTQTWVAHAKHYVDAMVARLGLGRESCIVEVGANDGYLLQHVAARGIPCFGVEPAAGAAAVARSKGIEIVGDFFGARLATELAGAGRQADLIAINNVLAHVPDINDFVQGCARLLKAGGVATFEFPHLMRLVAERQFDTIYHEHYSYLSLTTVTRIFQSNGLAVFDVEELPTHGGSLRVYAQRQDGGQRRSSGAVAALLERESASGMRSESFYAGFQGHADRIKNGLLSFLIQASREGARCIAYGAAAKGNTILNYAGVRGDLLPYVVDANPAKQGKYLPGSHIPIVTEERIKADRPAWVLILPWNIKDEVSARLAYIRDWGGRFVVAVPELNVLP